VIPATSKNVVTNHSISSPLNFFVFSIRILSSKGKARLPAKDRDLPKKERTASAKLYWRNPVFPHRGTLTDLYAPV